MTSGRSSRRVSILCQTPRLQNIFCLAEFGCNLDASNLELWFEIEPSELHVIHFGSQICKRLLPTAVNLGRYREALTVRQLVSNVLSLFPLRLQLNISLPQQQLQPLFQP
jgi:hypothetical protein